MLLSAKTDESRLRPAAVAQMIHPNVQAKYMLGLKAGIGDDIKSEISLALTISSTEMADVLVSYICAKPRCKLYW